MNGGRGGEKKGPAETDTQCENPLSGLNPASSLSQLYTLPNILLLKLGFCHLEQRILINTESIRSYT